MRTSSAGTRKGLPSMGEMVSIMPSSVRWDAACIAGPRGYSGDVARSACVVFHGESGERGSDPECGDVGESLEADGIWTGPGVGRSGEVMLNVPKCDEPSSSAVAFDVNAGRCAVSPLLLSVCAEPAPPSVKSKSPNDSSEGNVTLAEASSKSPKSSSPPAPANDEVPVDAKPSSSKSSSKLDDAVRLEERCAEETVGLNSLSNSSLSVAVSVALVSLNGPQSSPSSSLPEEDRRNVPPIVSKRSSNPSCLGSRSRGSSRSMSPASSELPVTHACSSSSDESELPKLSARSLEMAFAR